MPGSGFVTIGGGGGGASSHNRSGRSACQVTADTAFDNDSEEHIIKGVNDVKLRHLQTTPNTQQSQNAIVVSKQVTITTEDYDSERSRESFHPV